MRTVPALELRFPARPDAARLAEHALALLDDLGPTAIDEGTVEPDASDDPPRLWRVGFASADARDRAGALLERALAPSGLGVVATELEDTDWPATVEAAWGAVVLDRILVAAPGDVPSHPEKVVVVIQPSRGFGTGHHASTRLCLQALERLELRDRRVIDAGTGSGILAIAAAKLGARWVVAFDDDPDALVSAADNIARNGVAARVTLVGSDLRQAGRLGIDPADVVTANLTAGLLEREAPTLWGLVAPGGSLVVSGLLVEQVSEVEAALARAGGAHFARVDLLEADGWAGFVARRLR